MWFCVVCWKFRNVVVLNLGDIYFFVDEVFCLICRVLLLGRYDLNFRGEIVWLIVGNIDF